MKTKENSVDYGRFELLGPENIKEILAMAETIRESPVFRDYLTFCRQWDRVNGPDNEVIQG